MQQDFEHHARHFLNDTPEYVWAIDEWRSGAAQMLVVHLTVRQFSKELLPRMVKEWNVFRSLVTAPVFAIEDQPHDRKWRRFISHFGFQFLTTGPDPRDGIERAVFVSIKDKNNVDGSKHSDTAAEPKD